MLVISDFEYPILFDYYWTAGSLLGDIFCSDNSSLSLNGTTFSTFDHGVDKKLADESQSGWWFKPACLSDMNGITQASQMMQVSKELTTEKMVGTLIVIMNLNYYQEFGG